MQHKIQLLLSENDVELQTIEHEITDPCNIITAIEGFRKEVNDLFTRLIIKDEGNVDDDYVEEDISSAEEDSNQNLSPKKRKCN